MYIYHGIVHYLTTTSILTNDELFTSQEKKISRRRRTFSPCNSFHTVNQILAISLVRHTLIPLTTTLVFFRQFSSSTFSILIEIYYLHAKYSTRNMSFFFLLCVLHLFLLLRFFFNIHRFCIYIWMYIRTPVLFVSYCFDVMHSSMNR